MTTKTNMTNVKLSNAPDAFAWPKSHNSADMMLRLALMTRAPSWPGNEAHKLDSYTCRMCGQRIDDGNPCGCGAR